MSVDKVDPKRGYTIGNTVLCTAEANFIKGAKNLEEFKLWTENIHSRLAQWGAGPAAIPMEKELVDIPVISPLTNTSIPQFKGIQV